MTKAKIEPVRTMVNFLRNRLSDVNSSRSGQWILPEFPRITGLGDAHFPRIGIITLSESSKAMSMFENNRYETITFQIDVIAKKDQVHTLTVTDEALGTISSGVNSNRLVYNYIPYSVTNIKHNTTAYGTVTQRATDSAFTTPSAGTVEYSYSTGNLNFSSTDVTGHDGQSITSTYAVKLEGQSLVNYYAREIDKAIQNYWRTDVTINGLFYPVKINNSHFPLDEVLGIYRQVLEFQFNAFNLGEGL